MPFLRVEDWRKVIIMDAISKKVVEDTLIDVKFSGLSWRGNEGFYYSSYENQRSELSAKTDEKRHEKRTKYQLTTFLSR
jgi:prolyl oligopeptidase